MLKTLTLAAFSFPLLAVLAAQAQAEVLPISDPQAVEFFQQNLSGVFALPDRYAAGRTIRDGVLRVDYHPNVGLAMAQNGTALPFTVQTVDTANSSTDMLDKRGQLVTFRAKYGQGVLTFSDGYTQRMRFVRPLADQDFDILLQALVDGGLAVQADPVEQYQSKPAEFR